MRWLILHDRQGRAFMQVHADNEVQHASIDRLQRPTSHPCYTLKIRGGCDTYLKPDGSIGTAGKGALIQTDVSATLGVTQDQYLFVPKELCLNDQGGRDVCQLWQDRNAPQRDEASRANSDGGEG